MNKLKRVNRASSTNSSRSGQALMEYVLLLSAAALLSVGLATSFQKLTQFGFAKFNAVLESELRTGSFGDRLLRAWEN
jgi:hypothetical protein